MFQNFDISISLYSRRYRPLDLNRIEGIDVGVDDDDLLDVTPSDACRAPASATYLPKPS